MNPHILLRDQARTASLIDINGVKSPKRPNGGLKDPESSLSDFHAYISYLLSKPETTSAPPSALLSPTESVPSHRRRSSFLEEPTTIKEAIDFAILRNNQSLDSSRSKNRYEISRSGRRVAVVNLARPSYRLGETVHASIDFSNSDIPTYAISVALESSEVVDPSLALRSETSVSRVTRRTHATFAENVIFAKKVGLSLTIPWNASPEFVTTGVSSSWKVRVEFIGPRIEVRKRSLARRREDEREDDDAEPQDQGEKSPHPEIHLDFPKLLHEVSRDHRGAIFGALDRLQCDSFEVEVPIRVYGAVVEAGESTDVDDLVV
jgi:RAB6A-GEF complex partner protein 2